MRVEVDGYAWVPKAELDFVQLRSLREMLTVHPRKVGNHPGDKPGPIQTYHETSDRFGVPIGFFQENRRHSHEIIDKTSRGAEFPSPLTFNGTLKPEQEKAGDIMLRAFGNGRRGGVIQAPTGWGKTVFSAWAIAKMAVPTLVVVHKEYLLDQWKEELEKWLPGVEVGSVQGQKYLFKGRHAVIAMLQTLAARVGDGDLPEELRNWPGFIISDEVHKLGARTWSPVPAAFPAVHRIGLSATPRRPDGADKVFFYHLGGVMFRGKEYQLKPLVKRVWTGWSLDDDDQKKHLTSETLLVRFASANWSRNRIIVDQVTKAVQAERKILVLSHLVKHLHWLKKLFEERWGDEPPLTAIYDGTTNKKVKKDPARKEELLSRCVLWSTYMFFSDAINVPALDTLVLATPKGNVEQAAGRILRPHPNKKNPIIVDIRDDDVPELKKKAKYRDKFYSAKFGL